MPKLTSSNSSDKSPCYWHNTDTIRLTVTVQPNACCDEVIGKQGDAIKVRLSALPIDGKANKHLIK